MIQTVDLKNTGSDNDLHPLDSDDLVIAKILSVAAAIFMTSLALGGLLLIGCSFAAATVLSISMGLISGLVFFLYTINTLSQPDPKVAIQANHEKQIQLSKEKEEQRNKKFISTILESVEKLFADTQKYIDEIKMKPVIDKRFTDSSIASFKSRMKSTLQFYMNELEKWGYDSKKREELLTTYRQKYPDLEIELP